MPMMVIKHSEEGNSWEKGLILAHSLGYSVSQQQELEAAGYIVSSEKNGELLLSLLFPFIQPRTPSLGNGTANWSSYTNHIIVITLHRHGPRSIP